MSGDFAVVLVNGRRLKLVWMTVFAWRLDRACSCCLGFYIHRICSAGISRSCSRSVRGDRTPIVRSLRTFFQSTRLTLIFLTRQLLQPCRLLVRSKKGGDRQRAYRENLATFPSLPRWLKYLGVDGFVHDRVSTIWSEGQRSRRHPDRARNIQKGAAADNAVSPCCPIEVQSLPRA